MTSNYDLVMLYVVGKLFPNLVHIELWALCVYFKGFIQKTTPQPEINSHKES